MYIKSDVYGFGVVLLEILTGRRVLDNDRPKGEENLVEWARPYLPSKRRLRIIMDPRLERQYPLKAAFQAAQLILNCLENEPKNRPSMEEVLESLEEINAIKEESSNRSPLRSPLNVHLGGPAHQAPVQRSSMVRPH